MATRVFYEWDGAGTLDREFGVPVRWDIPLLDGYDSTFVPNASTDPGTHHFRGIDNPSLVRALEEWSPDVLLLYGWSFVSHIRVLRHFSRRVPIVFRGDSTLLDERRSLRTVVRRRLLRWIYSHVDVCIYTGSRNYDYYRAHGLRHDQLVWGPHAIDNARFASADQQLAESDARKWRARIGVPSDATVILFAGKLSPRKGLSTLFRAFTARLGPSAKNAHLLIVGDGQLSRRLRREASGRGDIHFLGFQNQTVMPIVYRMGDVFVLPSERGETWGLAVNEAMACRRPVVVSDRVGCAVDLIRPGETGYVFTASDEIELAAVLRKLIEDPDFAKSMGLMAASFIQDWSISAYSNRVAEVAEFLVSRRRRRLSAL